MPGTVLGARDIAVNKADAISVLLGKATNKVCSLYGLWKTKQSE